MQDYYEINDISDLISDLQKQLHINRNQLALKTGISASVLYRIEKGETVPTILTLTKVLQSVGYDLNMNVKKVE